MVKRSQNNSRSHNFKPDSYSLTVKNADSLADELIRSLSEKRENIRAKQTWEWEQVRRNTSNLRGLSQ